MEKYTDNYYVEKIRSGETDCFAPIVERYGGAMFSLIVKIVGNREDAEELTQDAFVKAFRSLSSFRGDSRFSTWIYRIAYNLAVSAVRKTKMFYAPVDERQLADVADVADETDDMLSATPDRLALLQQAMEGLKAEERAMVMLFYKENKAVDEIAAITGLTATNVKTKLFRIRKRLFVLIKSMEESER